MADFIQKIVRPTKHEPEFHFQDISEPRHAFNSGLGRLNIDNNVEQESQPQDDSQTTVNVIFLFIDAYRPNEAL